MEPFDIAKLASYRENNRIEAKSAKGCAFSSFAEITGVIPASGQAMAQLSHRTAPSHSGA